ncbi:MAG: hypB1 [Burkholderiaceae bacterium]|nr:hypB1 [Burkholderiaceae bacterium]
MCTVCGCGNATMEHQEHIKANPMGDLHFGQGIAGVSLPNVSQARTIKLEQDVLGANNEIAQRNRAHFDSHSVRAFNLVSSPGSGKTTLLCATIEALKTRHPKTQVAVIEGDQQTSNDADRIRATGAPAIQVNTGKGCHLDAMMIERAFNALSIHDHSHGEGHNHTHAHLHAPASTANLASMTFSPVHKDHADHRTANASTILFIENVGNLVCPAMWDLGERAKVAILSVTEGEDKPLKYPDMFAAASVMVLNKIDLLPYLNFDLDKCIAFAKRVNPTIDIIQVSATSGAGMDEWLAWLQKS